MRQKSAEPQSISPKEMFLVLWIVMCRKWKECGQQYENPSHAFIVRGTRMKMNQKD